MGPALGIRRLIPVAVALLVMPAPCIAAKPHAGTVDRTFGRDGRLVFNLPGERMHPRALALDRAGRILIAGYLNDSATGHSGRAFVVRFLRDGALDPSFGDGGVARIRLAKPVAIDALAIDPNGRLVLGGTAPDQPGERLAAVIRLLPSGAADVSFGVGGLTTLRAEKFYPYRHDVESLDAVAVLPDGRIVAAGSQAPYDVHSSADPFVLRLLPDGSPDVSFDLNGTAQAGPPHVAAIVSDPDGEPLIAGWEDVLDREGALTAFRFGLGSEDFPVTNAPPTQLRRYTFRNPVIAAGADVQADGNVVIAGEIEPILTRPFMAWARIGPDLELLGRGRSPADAVHAVAFDARGALLTAGVPHWGTAYSIHRFRGRRFRLDRSFGDATGRASVEVKAPGGVIGLAVQGDKLLLARYSWSTEAGGDQPLTLTRLHARQDGTGPIVSVRGLRARRCLDGVTRALIRIRDESRARTDVRLDGRRVATRRRKRFRLTLDPGRLAAGPHRLVIRSRDAAGNVGARETNFRICAA